MSDTVMDRAPVDGLDPFSIPFFHDPFPAHARLRDAGPVVWLPSIGCWAVARYASVHGVLHDHATFCSSRGVGMADFAKEKPWQPPSLVLERDPPEHTRARSVLSRILSPATVKGLRESFAAAAVALVESVLEQEQGHGMADIAQAFPLSVFPEALG